jgi:hypothetical protein
MAVKEGWISIHRAIQDNWVWKDANKLKWWLDILLTVNTSKAKVNIGNCVFECCRGESLLSLQSWATRWGVSKDTARNFLKLLEKDQMIVLGTLHGTGGVNSQKSTRLTVCKYDSYQYPLHVKQTTAVRPLYTNNKEDNNNNNNIVGFPEKETLDGDGLITERVNKFIIKFNELKLTHTGTLGKFRKTDDVAKKFKARIKNYKAKEIVSAIEKAFTHQLHKEQNYQYLTPSYILREEILERYINANTIQLESKNDFIYTERPKPINHANR